MGRCCCARRYGYSPDDVRSHLLSADCLEGEPMRGLGLRLILITWENCVGCWIGLLLFLMWDVEPRGQLFCFIDRAFFVIYEPPFDGRLILCLLTN